MAAEDISNICVLGDSFKFTHVFGHELLTRIFSKHTESKLHIIVKNKDLERKLLTNPQTVYSGLLDSLTITESPVLNEDSLKTALVGSQTLLASDLTLADLPMVASVAAGTTGLGRVVLGLRLAAEEEGVEQHAAQVDAAAALLQAAGTAYTIVKYAPLVDHQQQKQRIQSSESSFNPVGSSVTSQHPFRVVKGNVALPSATMGVTAQDLRKILTEVVDLPKTHGQVYGVGPGGALDKEIQTYMRSRGWSERVQVGVLMGDLMDRIQKTVAAENKRSISGVPQRRARGDQTESMSNAITEAPDTSHMLPAEGDGNKFAGFFV